MTTREARGEGRTALVHDWLTGMRGGEKVLEAIASLYPDAPIFTLLHVPGSVSAELESHEIHTSFVQHLPGALRHYRQYLPLFPRAIESFDLRGFDFVISTSHCVAKSVLVPPGTPHLCYCHSPMRYAWDQFDAYFGPAQVGRARSAVMRVLMARMARWDARTAARVDAFVANSQYVAGRIRRYYNRQATVVYPPVDTDFFHPDATPPERFALVVSALVPYKRIDVAIAACARAGVPLTIVGDGPERASLERNAPASTSFLGRVSDEDIRALYRRAAVALLPGEEDFGIVPLEAQACGRPVVALGRGGALETVKPGETGLLVADLSAEAFADAIGDAVDRRFEPATIRRHAEQFSRSRFGDEIAARIAEPSAW